MKPSQKILIVDDEPDLREVLQSMLRVITPQIITAGSGHEALDILSKTPVDAILSDISIPKMNGLEFLGHIRSGGSDVPFVVLSGYGDRDNLVQALRLGAFDFVDKPFDRSSLLKIMSCAADLGEALRTVDAQVEEYFKGRAGESDQLEELKKLKRAVVIMRVQRAIAIQQSA